MLYKQDISWLTFNYRILQDAADETVRLYERMKFLSIFSSNPDEFFRVRYPYVIATESIHAKKNFWFTLIFNGNDTDKPVQLSADFS
jgi:polyphosphate kinase